MVQANSRCEGSEGVVSALVRPRPLVGGPRFEGIFLWPNNPFNRKRKPDPKRRNRSNPIVTGTNWPRQASRRHPTGPRSTCCPNNAPDFVGEAPVWTRTFRGTSTPESGLRRRCIVTLPFWQSICNLGAAVLGFLAALVRRRNPHPPPGPLPPPTSEFVKPAVLAVELGVSAETIRKFGAVNPSLRQKRAGVWHYHRTAFREAWRASRGNAG